jgi:dTDP-4-dehydrorhamnose 3,5-epimerase
MKKSVNVYETKLSGLLIIEPKVYCDERGFFLETYQIDRYQKVGILDLFVQENHSRSKMGVLRGMHFQIRRPQAQLLTVMRGCIFDVVVDLRPNSPTFGGWHGMELSDVGVRQIYMPPGFAHGFCVLSDWADLHYKVSSNYDSSDEGGLHWSDPNIGIRWPIASPVVTLRDDSFPTLKELSKSHLPYCIDWL